MASYEEVTRTNYFQVKDPDALKRYVEKFNSITLVEESEGFVILAPEGIPCLDMETDEDVYFKQDVAAMLEDDHVIVFMTNGREKLRYLTGYAVALNNHGEERTIDLDNIFDVGKELGGVITQF